MPFTSLVDDLREGRPLGGRLAITFDDGYLDNHRTAAPILEAEGLPCTFFIATGFIESNLVPWWDRNAGIASEWMTWRDVEDLHVRGFDIGGHTITHADLSAVEGAVAYQEIVGGKQELEARLATPITVFSYPFGRAGQITEDNRRQVRDAGFRCCASAYGGTIRGGDDPFRLRRFPVSDWHVSVEQWGYEAAFGRWH